MVSKIAFLECHTCHVKTRKFTLNRIYRVAQEVISDYQCQSIVLHRIKACQWDQIFSQRKVPKKYNNIVT